MKYLMSVLCAACAGSVAAAQVVNGDFESGFIAPSTSAYGTNDIYAPQQYIITTYDTMHNSWVDFYDHTFGDDRGHYMVVNGSNAGVGPTWAQVVGVSANTDYTLSGWFASTFSAAIASVEFRVNGVVVMPTFSAPLTLGIWEQRSVTFNTGNATSISVEIWDSNQQFTGNDYAIDDIALTAVPTPGAAALLGLGGLMAARRRR